MGQPDLGEGLVIEFNGLDLSSAPYFPSEVTGLLDSPEVRTSLRPRLTRDGLNLGTTYLGGRTVAMTLDVIGWTEEELTQGLTAATTALQVGLGLAPLRFQLPGVAAGRMARVGAMVTRYAAPIAHEHFEHTATMAVEFVCPDPRIYSDDLITVEASSATVSGGLTFNAVPNLTFGTSGDSGTTDLVNEGNRSTPLRVTILGPCLNPSIVHLGLGRTLALGDSLGAGQVLTLDTDSRTVLVDGATRYNLLSSAQWFDLAPGSNEVRFTVGDADQGVATFTYRHAWT